jgi:hypothetical protein
LALKFDEAKTVERELSAYDQHPRYEETKSAGKKSLLLTKPLDNESRDIDNVVKMVKKLSNEVVDLKNNVGEGSSKPQTFHPFFKKPDNPPQPPEPPHMAFNLDSFSNDNFFSYHQQNHHERMCPQCINSMTLVINQLLYQRSLDDEIHGPTPSDTTNKAPP